MPGKILHFKRQLSGLELASLDGYQVAVATDDKEVMRKLRSEKVDVVVVDSTAESQQTLAIMEKMAKVAPAVKIVLRTDDTTAEWDFRSWVADAIIHSAANLGKFQKTIEHLLGRKRMTSSSGKILRKTR